MSLLSVLARHRRIIVPCCCRLHSSFRVMRDKMKPTLNTVTETELPALKDWLEKFLPGSFKLYHTATNILQGKWTGTTFCTLGWPNILAAGEGEVNQSCPCHLYHSVPRSTSVFSPDPEYLETLLTWPGFLDWNQPIEFQAISDKMRKTVEKVAKANEGDCQIWPNVLHEASALDLPPRPRPIPEGYTLGVLDPDLHTDYVVSTWPHSRRHTEIYVRELLKNFPSVGLFDNNGECIGIEIGNEYGAVGMLHVREESRGRGLGKVITSQLAQKYFCDGLPVIACVSKVNESSRRMHTSCGFREVGSVDWIVYHKEDLEELKRNLAFQVKA